VECVKRNRSQWIEEGEKAINLMIQQDERERLNRRSVRSTVSASDVTVTTDNHVQSRKNGERSSSNSDSKEKVPRTRSLETGEGRECISCGAADSRFNCPRCSSPYCSAQCCREHKSECI
jgi:hypothetical protein